MVSSSDYSREIKGFNDFIESLLGSSPTVWLKAGLTGYWSLRSGWSTDQTANNSS